MSDRLMELLKFTPGDLDYNRSGMLSPEQQVRAAKERGARKGCAAVIGLILLVIAAGWSFIFAQQLDDEGSGALFAIIIGVILFGLPGLFALWLAVRPARKIEIEKVEGKVKVARVEHTSTVNNHTTRVVKTEMHMGDKIFVVPDEAYSELEDGAEYILYTWKGTGEIFSLEKR